MIEWPPANSVPQKAAQPRALCENELRVMIIDRGDMIGIGAVDAGRA